MNMGQTWHKYYAEKPPYLKFKLTIHIGLGLEQELTAL